MKVESLWLPLWGARGDVECTHEGRSENPSCSYRPIWKAMIHSNLLISIRRDFFFFSPKVRKRRSMLSSFLWPANPTRSEWLTGIYSNATTEKQGFQKQTNSIQIKGHDNHSHLKFIPITVGNGSSFFYKIWGKSLVAGQNWRERRKNWETHMSQSVK